MKKKFIVILLFIVCAAIGAYFVWQCRFAPTRIALVEYMNASVADVAKAAAGSRVEIVPVKKDELAKLKRADVVLVAGMGLQIDEDQRELLRKIAASAKPIYVGNSTNPDNKITNLDSVQIAKLTAYMQGGSDKFNTREMLNYIRRELDGKTYGTHETVEARDVNSEVFVYPAEDMYFASVEEYRKYYREKGLYRENAPNIAVFTAMVSPLGENTEQVDELVYALQRKGFNVYPYAGIRNRLAVLQELNPDAVINFPHGRFAMMQGGDAAVEWLRKRNIPMFAPLTMMRTYDEWIEDKMGMFGPFMSQSIIVPEMDGAILPYVFFTTKRNEEGLYPYKVIPQRLETFTDIVSKQVNLQRKPNAEKKVAIFYFKGTGKNALVAAGMEVVPSLYNVLKHLKAEGYRVDNLPSTVEGFNKMVMAQGAVMEPYAKGMIDEFIQNGRPTFVEKGEYEAWAGKALPPESYAEVVKRYGEAPGEYMAVERDGKQYIAVARVDFGNVSLLPQPMPAVGDNTFQMVHGAKVAPPHTYIAPYLWAQYGYEADAIIHYGTHGSLEFTPGKSVALSDYEWSDRLIGKLPHFYIYTIGNVGEGMIAKRRSYATLVSHLTPPFTESATRGQYKELFDRIKAYHKNPQEQASLAVKKTAVKLGLHRDLRMDSTLNKPYSDEDIVRIENFAEEIAEGKITGASYVMGVPYESERLNTTALAMTVDPIAYSTAALDRYRGKITAKQLENKPWFTEQYLDPAKKIVARILQGNRDVSGNEIRAYAGISVEDWDQALAYEASKNAPRRPMGGNPSAQATSQPKPSGHPANIPKTGGHPEGIPKSGGHPAGIPKTGGHPDNVPKTGGHPEGIPKSGGHPAGVPKTGGHPEGIPKGEQQGKETVQNANAGRPAESASQVVEYTKEQKDYFTAILDLKRTFENVGNYRQYLRTSPQTELDMIVNALAGGYIAPSPGGDPVANPNTLPTGRNLYSVNVEATPTETAWETGKQLANAFIADYRKRHDGEYPRRVNVTLWAGSFIETEGAPIAQILSLLGVEPLRDAYGRVSELKLIPSEELGRPRVDVVLQTSGQLRDVAASRLFLVSKAVAMAAEADDKAFPNQVALTSAEAEKLLIDKGMSPREAKEMSTRRVFGGVNGYGTGMGGMVQNSDRWTDEKQIADTYINNMSGSYDSEKDWGAAYQGVFETMLHSTDAVIHNRQSNTWGALSLDHVYEFMGGVNLAVRTVTGKDPESYFSDFRNRHNPRVQELKESVGVEARTTIFNPVYIKEQMKGGATSASGFTATFENIFGWNVMKPSLIDKEMWDEMYDVYVKDKHNLGVTGYFERENPYALQEMTAVMMEASRKGYWKASEGQLADVAGLHTGLVTKFGSSGSGKTAGNALLQAEMVKHTSDGAKQQYTAALDKAMKVSAAPVPEGKSVVLKKEGSEKDAQQQNANASQEASDSNSLSMIFIIGGVLLGIIVVIVVIRRRK